MTLMELTGHEAGIIVYPDETGKGNSVAVWNWAALREDQLPMLTPFGGMIGWPSDGIFNNAGDSRTVEDVRAELPGTIWLNEEREVCTDMDIVSDEDNDLIRLFLGADESSLAPYNPEMETTSAEVYTLADGTKIIVPHEWA